MLSHHYEHYTLGTKQHLLAKEIQSIKYIVVLCTCLDNRCNQSVHDGDKDFNSRLAGWLADLIPILAPVRSP